MSGDYKIPVGPLVALCGAVILIVSLFLDWYESLTGWTVFEIVDLVLVGLALWTIFSLAGAFGIAKTSNPVAALIGAVVTLVIVVTQIINDPPAVAGGGPDKDVGIWLALGGAGLMVVGAALATTHISLAVETRQRQAEEDEATEPL